jgi:glycosyltransferase involved in cell wall biosynthesis
MGTDLPAAYIFHLGNNAAYKNRVGVVKVFARLRDCVNLHLVLAGPPPTPELLAAAAGLARVHFMGPVGDRQLAELYRRATMLLFPSRYEGYGSPVLEAMALGCPVVCSTAPSLLEVAAEAALFAPADDPDALAAHCRSLLADESLRTRMVERGRLRAAAFDVATMGRSLMEWYETALNKMRTKEAHD